MTLYLSGMGVLAERFGELLGPQRWTSYLMAGGRLVGIHVENADETTLTRYFHTDHLGSIAVITNEAGVVQQRLSYDAWGLRRHPDGTPDPSGAITAESTRGFTGHEHLAEVGLIHMNGRVYDPLLARFGTPDPMTEDPYSTQGWNRYSYVGNSPVNFTDPSGYCFMGCFWQRPFRAIARFFRENWGAIVQIAASAICSPAGLGPVCGAVAAAVVTGITSGNLGLAIRAGITAFITAEAFNLVGDITGHRPSFGTANHAANIAGHALVGCASSVARGGRCGPGALSGAVGSFASPLLSRMDFTSGVVAHAVIGGLASVAGGGKFANGAVTAAFGYLFNYARVTANGRRISIELRISFVGPGATPDVIQAFVDGIQSTWSGRIGGYDVDTKVTVASPSDADNVIYVVKGDNGGVSWVLEGSCMCYGEWASDFTGAGFGLTSAENKLILQTLAAHEAGHLMGLGHSNDPNSIMQPGLADAIGGTPSSKDIGDIINKKWPY